MPRVTKEKAKAMTGCGTCGGCGAVPRLFKTVRPRKNPRWPRKPPRLQYAIESMPCPACRWADYVREVDSKRLSGWMVTG